jgi:hypothetical protein
MLSRDVNAAVSAASTSRQLLSNSRSIAFLVGQNVFFASRAHSAARFRANDQSLDLIGNGTARQPNHDADLRGVIVCPA